MLHVTPLLPARGRLLPDCPGTSSCRRGPIVQAKGYVPVLLNFEDHDGARRE
jgi:hypothetical protein